MTDRDDIRDAVTTVDGAVIAKTSNGDRRTIDVTMSGKLRLTDTDGDVYQVLTPRRLLDLLTRGEYYFPRDSVRTELRTLRNTEYPTEP